MKGQILVDSILYEAPAVVYLTETEGRMGVVRGWQEGGREWLFSGYRCARRKMFWRLVAEQCEHT
jgi:hypothetical protein